MENERITFTIKKALRHKEKYICRLRDDQTGDTIYLHQDKFWCPWVSYHDSQEGILSIIGELIDRIQEEHLEPLAAPKIGSVALRIFTIDNKWFGKIETDVLLISAYINKKGQFQPSLNENTSLDSKEEVERAFSAFIKKNMKGS